MPRKEHAADEIIGRLREAEVLLAQGKKVPEVVRSLGVTEQTYYRWRNEYGGLKVDQAKRLKELERVNARLKRAVADPTLDKLILKEAEAGRPSGQVTTSKPATNPLETRVLPLGNKETGGEENA